MRRSRIAPELHEPLAFGVKSAVRTSLRRRWRGLAHTLASKPANGPLPPPAQLASTNCATSRTAIGAVREADGTVWVRGPAPSPFLPSGALQPTVSWPLRPNALSPLTLRAMLHVGQVDVSKQPCPSMPCAMLRTAAALLQHHLELIAAGGRWPVRAIVVTTAAHHLGPQRCMARGHGHCNGHLPPPRPYPRGPGAGRVTVPVPRCESPTGRVALTFPLARGLRYDANDSVS